MNACIRFYPFGGPPMSAFSNTGAPWLVLIENLAAGEIDEDRYDLIEMSAGDDDSIEVVTLDGEPIGVIGRNDIGRDDLARFA